MRSSCKFFFDQYAKKYAAKGLTANKTIGGVGVLSDPQFEVYKESIFKWKIRKNLLPGEECDLLDLPFRYVSCWFLKSLVTIQRKKQQKVLDRFFEQKSQISMF